MAFWNERNEVVWAGTILDEHIDELDIELEEEGSFVVGGTPTDFEE
jgi:hypothetical protein